MLTFPSGNSVDAHLKKAHTREDLVAQRRELHNCGVHPSRIPVR
jgi:hypothetical protein